MTGVETISFYCFVLGKCPREGFDVIYLEANPLFSKHIPKKSVGIITSNTKSDCNNLKYMSCFGYKHLWN